MRKFEITDHTADVGIVAYGATLEELFANAALGMFSIIGDVGKVVPRERQELTVGANGLAGLLAAFLAELLYRFDADHFMLHDAEVTVVSGAEAQAVIRGEPIATDAQAAAVSDAEVRAVIRGEPIAPHHDLHTEIKAVTHHGLSVEKIGDTWRATVLFDI